MTIVQNYICTIDYRLKLLLGNIPALGKTFGEYGFVVNFNDSINLDPIHSSYKEHIKKLKFYNNLEKDWALVTLALVEQVKTPYLMYLCEDQMVHADATDIKNILDEMVKLDIKFTNLTKIRDYSNPKYEQYTEQEFGYHYLAKDAPHARLSSDCIVNTDFWKARLIEFIENKDTCPHTVPYPNIHAPNYFEGYMDKSLGIRRWDDMNCYIPKKHILIEENGTILEKHTYA